MINSISLYINNYIVPFPNNDLPGEHHFVALYLVPKIYKLLNKIPNWVNPDGMKRKPGDIIYDDLSIEVKYLKINLTKTQYNEWIIGNKKKPNILIALGRKTICIINWERFVKYYQYILKTKNKKIVPYKSGYTPLINTDILADYCIPDEECFKISENNIERKIENRIKEIFSSQV